jgi:phospholipase/lecithinase/hemolysin
VGNRASNGPVAVEYLWQTFNPGNNSFKPSLVGGTGATNYSIIGATTGLKNNLQVSTPPSALNTIFADKGSNWQLNQFKTAYPTSSSFNPETSLFLLWLFPNDVFYCLNTLTNATSGACLSVGTSAGADSTATNLPLVPGLAVSNLIASVNTLANAGARNFLVVNSPDLGLTPAFSGNNPLKGTVSALSQGFNTALEIELNKLATANPQLDIELFRVDDALNSLTDNPSEYGFTNVIDPCLTNMGVCSDPSTYLFWDALHPTTRTHQILAQQLYGIARDPVPAPMPFLGGLAALGWSRRLRQRLRQNRQGQGVQQTKAG